jgi:hypothetical protein
MTLNFAQQAFFDTGSSANFDNYSLWDKVPPEIYGPFDQVVSELALNDFDLLATTKKFFKPSFILPVNSETGTDDEDLRDTYEYTGTTALEFIESEFEQALAFTDKVINYDFYLSA